MAASSTPMAHLPAIDYCGRFAERLPVPFHEHRVCELVLVTEGSCRIELARGGEPVAGPAGTLLGLPGREPHNQVNDGFCRTTYLGFDAPRLAFSERPRAVRLGVDDPSTRWFEDVCSLWASRPAAEAALSALLLAVLERVKA